LVSLDTLDTLTFFVVVVVAAFVVVGGAVVVVKVVVALAPPGDSVVDVKGGYTKLSQVNFPGALQFSVLHIVGTTLLGRPLNIIAALADGIPE
jgi:hypothetical protein